MTRRELFARFDSKDLAYEWVLHTKLIPLPNPARESAEVQSILWNSHFKTEEWVGSDKFMSIDEPEVTVTVDTSQPQEDQQHYAGLVHKLLGG